MADYIIFGGGGFIGTHLRAHLLHINVGAKVHVADVADSERGAFDHHCDVRKPIGLEVGAGPESVIFNLAAVHTTPGHADHEYFCTNMLGAENVCDFARKTGARRIVFTSSIAPYGPGEDRKTEDTLPTPTSPYGISKLVAEKIHMIWQAEDVGRKLSIVRPGVVFGKGEGGNFTRLYRALHKGLFAYPGRRDTLKAAIYVKDLVRVMVEMASAPRSNMQLYNACFKDPPRIDEIVRVMQHTIGQERWVPQIPPVVLRSAAKVLGLPGLGALGFHPDRVEKLMTSTNIDGSRLDRDYPLGFTLQDALEDWWRDCDRKGLV